MRFDEKVIALARMDNCAIEPRDGKYMLVQHGKDVLFGTFEECTDRMKVIYSRMFHSVDAIRPLILREGEIGVEKIARFVVGEKDPIESTHLNWAYCVCCLIVEPERLVDAYLKYKGFEIHK
jgi:hypothetical protein